MAATIYDVVDFNLGDKQKGDHITFKSINDMEEAYKAIDNGNDIYIKKEGLVTKLLGRMINTKVYDGTLRLSAKEAKK